jgi:hypothetical protein
LEEWEAMAELAVVEELGELTGVPEFDLWAG